ncbi:carboxymuconolactone decarboxylase family protein [Rhizomicrobium electricum]|uniref:Carboxymuconolactone decarboxylase family protein n=1 Tax=Rhizomicrobium electricum TaxID=480070 RepID=A0ABN1F1C8_9PROT|nr:carboxymuconolactone decarboxylase family protein [Rhizomicrobium electricum]NIJ50265.1 AhpD family alkylhydroperoxidase [Rhizomicrobium electricum]
MSQRLDYAAHSKSLVDKLVALSAATKKEGSIERGLLHLVDIRASQINGCAFCLDMHSKEAKIDGERELRLYHVAVWRESPLFSARERAVLEWTEAVTKLGEHGVADEIYARVREQLSEKEIADLTFAIVTINAWNRLAIAFRAVPGSADAAYGLGRAGLQ